MKRLFFNIIILLAVTIIPLAAVNYIVDPLQCFRVARWYAPLYDSNERVQSPCLARSHKYDTIITGSSHVENFDPAYIDSAFGGAHTIKLAMAASTLYEQKQLLDLALSTDQVKNVVWGLDTNILNDGSRRARSDIVPFPEHIFKPNFYNNILFLLDPYIIKHYIKMAAHSWLGMYGEYTNLRYLNNWESLFTFSKERALLAYGNVKEGKMAAIENSPKLSAAMVAGKVSTDNIDQNIIAVVQAHPEVEFYIHFPPYSILRWVQLYQDKRGEFEAELRLKKYLITKLLEYDNVRLSDFQHLSEITHNLDYYKDLTHFSGAINSRIIDSAVKGDSNVRREDGASALEILRQQVEHFDFTSLK